MALSNNFDSNNIFDTYEAVSGLNKNDYKNVLEANNYIIEKVSNGEGEEVYEWAQENGFTNDHLAALLNFGGLLEDVTLTGEDVCNFFDAIGESGMALGLAAQPIESLTTADLNGKTYYSVWVGSSNGEPLYGVDAATFTDTTATFQNIYWNGEVVNDSEAPVGYEITDNTFTFDNQQSGYTLGCDNSEVLTMDYENGGDSSTQTLWVKNQQDALNYVETLPGSSETISCENSEDLFYSGEFSGAANGTVFLNVADDGTAQGAWITEDQQYSGNLTGEVQDGILYLESVSDATNLPDVPLTFSGTIGDDSASGTWDVNGLPVTGDFTVEYHLADG